MTVYVPSDECTCPFKFCGETIGVRGGDDLPPDSCSLGHRPKVFVPVAPPTVSRVDLLTEVAALPSVAEALGMSNAAFLSKYYLDPAFHAAVFALIDTRALLAEYRQAAFTAMLVEDGLDGCVVERILEHDPEGMAIWRYDPLDASEAAGE